VQPGHPVDVEERVHARVLSRSQVDEQFLSAGEVDQARPRTQDVCQGSSNNRVPLTSSFAVDDLQFHNICWGRISNQNGWRTSLFANLWIWFTIIRFLGFRFLCRSYFLWYYDYISSLKLKSIEKINSCTSSTHTHYFFNNWANIWVKCNVAQSGNLPGFLSGRLDGLQNSLPDYLRGPVIGMDTFRCFLIFCFLHCLLKIGPLRVIWHNLTISQHLLIIFGREWPYLMFNWLQ